jgi:hypothetical protein
MSRISRRSAGSTSAMRPCGSGGTGLARCSPPRSARGESRTCAAILSGGGGNVTVPLDRVGPGRNMVAWQQSLMARHRFPAVVIQHAVWLISWSARNAARFMWRSLRLISASRARSRFLRTEKVQVARISPALSLGTCRRQQQLQRPAPPHLPHHAPCSQRRSD